MASSRKAQSYCSSAGWSRGAGQASPHCTLAVTQGAAQMRKPRPGGARPRSWDRTQARPPPAPGTSDDGARGEDGPAESSEHGRRGPWPQAQRGPRQDGPKGHALLVDHGEAEVQPEHLRDLNGKVASQAAEEVLPVTLPSGDLQPGCSGVLACGWRVKFASVFPCSLTWPPPSGTPTLHPRRQDSRECSWHCYT